MNISLECKNPGLNWPLMVSDLGYAMQRIFCKVWRLVSYTNSQIYLQAAHKVDTK